MRIWKCDGICASGFIIIIIIVIIIIINLKWRGERTSHGSAIFKYHFIIFISFNRFTLNTYPLEHLPDNCNASVQIWLES